jgi:hypothetical protein
MMMIMIEMGDGDMKMMSKVGLTSHVVMTRPNSLNLAG